MAKKLRTRDYFLLGLALLGDLLDETVGEGYRMQRGIYLSKYSLMPPHQKKANFTHSVWRMLRAGEVERVVKDGKPYLRITGEGRKRIVRDFSLFNLRKKRWTQKWCLVIFDIQEKDRSLRKSLRTKLLNLGFGLLQKSAYISPYDFSNDLVDYFDSRGILGQVLVLNCKHRLMGDPLDLSSKVWSLEDLNQQYEEIFDNLSNLKAEFNSSLMEETKNLFESTLELDPLLPRELLPERWCGDKVFELLGL